MGACLDLIMQATRTLLIEANAVTDNPLVFARPDAASDDTVLSGGNFHAEPVAFAADTLALAIAEIGALSERRVALLIDATLSGLPPFLVRDPGVNSGFMIAHVTAAALASENKSLAHPASVDSLPTSANQEDHVSMATFAARRLHEMAANTRDDRRHRTARCGAGHRLPRAARDVAAARPYTPAGARACAVLPSRPHPGARYRGRHGTGGAGDAERRLSRPVCSDRVTKAMTTIDMSVWQGRADDLEGPLGRRWHQLMRPRTSATPAATTVLLGFACDAGVARNQARVGAAEGPRAIRHALRNMPLHECTQLADAGDVRLPR